MTDRLPQITFDRGGAYDFVRIVADEETALHVQAARFHREAWFTVAPDKRADVVLRLRAVADSIEAVDAPQDVPA